MQFDDQQQVQRSNFSVYHEAYTANSNHALVLGRASLSLDVWADKT